MKKYQGFLSDFFQFLVVKFSIYLNRRVFVMRFGSLATHSVHCKDSDQTARMYRLI